ncbi:protein of unknown function (DUF3181) [Rubidibacter lacunae KORDI 51-2]|uniref:Thylakoid-associated protein n=1 Tax=Rubidibacter lacunae KORDI 51-2 TaxID=582515 RepID=U5DR61_9CHRO|nr:DUF3181 family protein [Rubidibacter lacunae]ERN42175.1 protein of unknown function (DUF3181) [Rubidibacter lacunae KORDI 51-2]
MSDQNVTRELEALAAEIGDKVYIDVAKWHLYLRDAHLHSVVAARIYPLLESRTLSEDAVLDILRDIPVKLGGGRKQLPLADLLPMQGQVALLDLLEEYQEQL